MSAKHPTPWSFKADDEFEDNPILDANGEAVIVRDSGFYPPDLETCREIVEAVNEIAAYKQFAKAADALTGLPSKEYLSALKDKISQSGGTGNE